jgi:thiol-disulfide isomerase/thioredoxin
MIIQRLHSGRLAPELVGDYWLNSPPVAIQQFEGNIILLNFWSSTSTSSLKTLRMLGEWNRKYRDYGLVLIGIHLPQFDFEKQFHHITRVLEAHDVHYATMMDNGWLMADLYDVRTVPTQYLIDREGSIRYRQSTDTGMDEFERTLQALLIENGMHGILPPLNGISKGTESLFSIDHITVHDVHTGYLRGTLGNVESYAPESRVQYQMPEDIIEGRFYLSGSWYNGRESVRFDGNPGERGELRYRFLANDLNCVLSSPGTSPIEVGVTSNGRLLDNNETGVDISVDNQRTIVSVGEAGLYNIVRGDAPKEREISLITETPSLEIFLLSSLTIGRRFDLPKN